MSESSLSPPSGVRRLGISILASALVVAPASAVELDYGLGYGAVYSSNIGLSDDNEQREWINLLRGLFSAQEVTDRVDARFYSLLELRQYTQTDYEDEALLALDGSARWVLSPQRLTLEVEDRFTQVPITPTGAITPSNRQDTNVFSIGPDLHLRFSPINSADFGLRYIQNYYEAATTDSDRLGGHARLTHLVSPITRVTANYEPSYVNYYDDDINPDYTRQDVFVGARTNRLGLDMSFDFGKIYIDRHTDAIRDVEGTLLRASLTRQINAETALNLSAADEYSDSGRDTLIVDPTVVGPPSQTAINATDFVGGGLYATQHIDANYTRRRYYGNNLVRAYWRELDFESPQILLDHRIVGAFADIGFDYSSAMGTSVFGNYSETEYLRRPRTDKDQGIGARVIYRFMRTLSLSLEGRFSQRRSSVPEMSYDELRAVATIAYNTNYAMTVNNPFLEQNNPLYR